MEHSTPDPALESAGAMPVAVRASVGIVADPHFGSARYWHRHPVHTRGE